MDFFTPVYQAETVVIVGLVVFAAYVFYSLNLFNKD